MKILAMAVESTFVGHRKYLRFLGLNSNFRTCETSVNGIKKLDFLEEYY